MNTARRISEFWRRRSLRFWLATGMLMAIGPILVFSILGYVLYERTITRPLVDVSHEQRNILQPLQRVQLALWDMSEIVIDYALAGQDQRADEYRQKTAKIERDIDELILAFGSHPHSEHGIDEVRQDWKQLSAAAGTIMADTPLRVAPVASAKLHAFEASMGRLGHDLGTIYEDIRIENEHTHSAALSDLVLAERLILSGFALSIILAMVGILLINRSLVNSTDQLLVGAQRLAAGERNHHIAIQLPDELVRVADAFNLMTSQIQAQEAALAHVARTDALTGLFNRREFDRILAEAIQRYERYGGVFSLIMCDIDHFKRFNDSHGHLTGDKALQAVAGALRNSLREVDKASRYGGEEFVLVLPECDADATLIVAERIREAVAALQIRLDDARVVQVSVSLGIASCPQHGTTYESLLRNADLALYEAKASGRNRVVSAV